MLFGISLFFSSPLHEVWANKVGVQKFENKNVLV